MHPLELQRSLIDRFLPIEDPQERLSAVVDRARKLPPISETERTEANLVRGCSSRVWVVAELIEGCCHFRVDADSTLVKGLAGLLCEVYEGTLPSEAAIFEPTLLEELHLAARLSPTRQYGLAQVSLTLRRRAAALDAAASA